MLHALLCCTYSFAQSPHPAFQNFSTLEGLPSQEVHDVLQDKAGYMWFATDNGLSRFDGYSFQNYSLEEGLEDLVLFDLQEDSKGRIWMSTISGRFFILEGDTIQPYQHNSKIQELKPYFTYILDFHWSELSQDLFICPNGLGIIKIDEDGKWNPVLNEVNEYFLTLELDDRLFTNHFVQKDGIKDRYQDTTFLKELFVPPLFFVSKDTFKISNILQEGITRPYYGKGFKCGDSDYLIRINQKLISIKDQAFKQSWSGEGLLNVVSQAPDKEYWTGYLKQGGVWIYPDIAAMSRGEGLHLFQNLSITDIFWDRNNGAWISSIEQGVFYIPNWRIFVLGQSGGLKTSIVSSVSPFQDQKMLLSLWNGDVGVFDLNTYQYTQKASFNHAIWNIQHDPTLHCIAICTNGKTSYVNESFDEEKEFFHKKGGSLSSIDYILNPAASESHESRYIFSPRGIFKTLPPYQATLDFERINALIEPTPETGLFRALFQDVDRRLWVGTDTGLWQLQEDSLVSFMQNHPSFNVRVEAIDALKDGTLVIGTKGQGVTLWNEDEFISFSKENGLSTNVIEMIHVSDKDEIWVGTLEGMFRLYQKGQQWKVQPINQFHGLPSNEIWDIETQDSMVWVATGKGAAWFTPQEINIESPAPTIQDLLVNGKQVRKSSNINKEYYENNLSIQVWSPNYRMMEQVLYRYRLTADLPWEYTSQPIIRFAALSPGNYEFEVQARNEDNIWSESTQLSILIRQAWYASVWFWSLVVLGISTVAYGYYRLRVDGLKAQLTLKDEMNTLELQAIRAQMNPHFIFNCLNSIQNNIINGDEEKAVRYLAKFAQLIRQVLNASMREQITLQEELDLIQNYVTLEQVRFPNRFSFEVNRSKEVDVFDSIVPPLILQPFVENAILHAFDEKMTGAKIWINIKNDGDCLLIEIRDNGKGESHEKWMKPLDKNALHSSVGLTLTNRRLQLFNQTSNGVHLNIQPQNEHSISPEGTIITLFINQSRAS